MQLINNARLMWESVCLNPLIKTIQTLKRTVYECVGFEYSVHEYYELLF